MELIELQVTACFRADTRGRLLGINETDSDQLTPRLFLGRTRTGNIWRFRYDLPDSLVRELQRLLRNEPVAADLSQPPRVLPALIETLRAHAPIQGISMGPAWRFPEVFTPPEEVVAMTAANLGVCRGHFPWTATHLEELQPCRAVVTAGEAVSLCFSSRNARDAAEAGVFTVEAFRGRGYAPAVVAAWAIAVRESNRIPLYSTSWDNLASQAVARKLALVLYGADLSIT